VTAPIDERLAAALAGRYTLERELGSGGMATVYLAQDVRHGRKVALKVMRPELAAVIGADRFLQEIKTTANLQHPHILPLHDSGEVNGTVFYVMPFIDGETLRDRLDREKQLPVEDAVRITREIADALGYAHGQGVIHRDIKPENILLQGGHALVADFGIALAAARTGGSRMTETGMSLGTPTYMSPEQAMGERSLDARTDLYALGCVLYEMLAGEPPFAGPTPQAIVAKILTDEPRRLTELRKTVPPHIDAAAREALEKIPADRFATAADFAAALVTPGFTRPGDLRAAKGGVPARWYRRTSIPVIVIVIGLLIAGLLPRLARRGGSEDARVLRVGMQFPRSEQPRVATFGMPILALAPDGSGLVYSGPGRGTRTQLWLRRWDQPTATAIAGTDEPAYPAFSPDGKTIAFITKPSRVKVVSLTGGLQRVVADTGMVDMGAYGSGVAWGPDGMLYASGRAGLLRIALDGSARRVVAPLVAARGDRSFALPNILPNGKGALVTIVPQERFATGAFSIGIVDFATGKVEPVLKGTHARYLKSGVVVYAQPDGVLMAVPFDQDQLRITGSPVALGDTIALSRSTAALGDFEISPTGDLIYMQAVSSITRVVWVEPSGAERSVSPLLESGYFTNPRLSPDGRRLSITSNTGEGEALVVVPLNGGPLARLTFDGSVNERAIWSPDGQRIAWVSDRGTIAQVYVRRADGGGDPALLRVTDRRPIYGIEWPASGGWILLRTDDQAAGHADIIGIRAGGDSVARSFVATPAEELAPALSPNGRWLAYSSDETGRREVFVRPFPETDRARYQVSSGGGTEPLWSRDGRELFFRGANEQLIAVPIGSGTEFQPGAPRTLFDASVYLQVPQGRNYDVGPDGRFVMVRDDAPPASRIVVVFGFTKELAERMRR
jgi:Tol biopolymer transport system component